MSSFEKPTLPQQNGELSDEQIHGVYEIDFAFNDLASYEVQMDEIQMDEIQMDEVQMICDDVECNLNTHR